MKKNTISIIKFFLGWPLSLVAIFFLAKFIFSQTTHLSLHTFHPNGWLIFLGLVSFFLYFLIRSVFWNKLLRLQGYIFSLKETSFLWSISELQRYIPGNIWSILGRNISFEKKGVEKKTTTKLWIYEAEFLCLSSVFLSMLATNFLVFGLLPHFAYKGLLVAGFNIITWAGIIIFLFNQKFIKQLSFFKHILPIFSVSHNTFLFILMLGAMWFFGVGTYLSIISFTPLFPYDFNTFVGFFVFAYIVGYLSFIFPMGLGPREGIMTYGLSKFISVSMSGIGALFSRTILIAAEIVFLLFIVVWYKIPEIKLHKLVTFIYKHKYLFATLGIILIYIVYFTTASIMRYNNFFAGRFDLGNMDQTVWNTVHGRIFQLTDPDGTNIISRLSVHADFILILLAPFYYLWQDPRMLLVIQAIILGFGALFVYLLGSDVTKNKIAGFVFAFLYLLNPAIEYTNLYDFHGVTLATTFFLGSFYFLKKKKTILFLLFLLLAGSTKEEAWVVVALLGLYTFFIEKRKILGASIFAVGSALFYFIFFKAIPMVRGGQHFAVGFYSDFGNSPSSILKTMLLSPKKTLAVITEKDKLVYIYELLLPFGFLSLVAPFLLIFALPDLVINLLSNNQAFHEIYYQYTAVISAFLFIATIYGFTKVQKRFPLFTTNKLLGIILVCAIFAAYTYGPLPISKRPSVDMFWLQQPNKEVINDFLNSIPRRYSIAATNNVGSHLSHRQLIYTIPTGIDKADILVFLLNDKYAQPSLKAQIQMTEKLRSDPHYVEAIHLGDFVVFEKKSIYPHMRTTNRPNSLFPSLIQGLKQGFNGKGSAPSKSS